MNSMLLKSRSTEVLFNKIYPFQNICNTPTQQTHRSWGHLIFSSAIIKYPNAYNRLSQDLPDCYRDSITCGREKEGVREERTERERERSFIHGSVLQITAAAMARLEIMHKPGTRSSFPMLAVESMHWDCLLLPSQVH